MRQQMSFGGGEREGRLEAGREGRREGIKGTLQIE